MQTKKLNFIFLLAVVLAVAFNSCKPGSKPDPGTTPGQLQKGVILVDYRESKKVDVFIDGDVFTSYIYPETLAKPVLFPLRSAEGTNITRGFPLEPRAGERVDHPHQVGAWFNFGDVNGYDFWTNSYATPAEKISKAGRVLHRGVKRAESREALGILEIAADWQVPADEGRWHTILQENTIFEFSGSENTRTIDRITRLTAQEDELVFSDSKEGLFAVRVSRELETPSDEPRKTIDADGNIGDTKSSDNEGVNGSYLNSEGISGTDVWGKRARWVTLTSSIRDEKLSLTLFDHPGNHGYPSYWHARDYGLLSVNNLGARAFDNNAEPARLVLQPGESIVFRHRLHIASGSKPGAEQIEVVFKDFTGK